jgi:hypothetical protein
VHYAPLPAATPEELAVANDPSNFEYLELLNISETDIIDLTDVHFEAGINLTFTDSLITSLAPGEGVLVVRNQEAFKIRYGTLHSYRIAGHFAPARLANAGERLHLVDGFSETIADFSYNDKNPWPADVGVTGYSIVLKSLAVPNPTDTQPLVGPPTSGFVDAVVDRVRSGNSPSRPETFRQIYCASRRISRVK